MNVKEMKEVVPLLMNSDIVPFIWGKSGIGKTEIVKEIAKNTGMDLVYLTFGAVEDVGDIIGLPYFEEINGRNVTKHAAPEWFPTEDNTLIFIDEFNRAKPQILQAMLPFILEGKLHTHQLPKGCRIVVAGNPPTEDYDVTSMEDNALLARFCHLNFTPSVDDWTIYMKSKNRNGGVISFFDDNKELLTSRVQDFDLKTIAKHDRRNAEMLSNFLDQNKPSSDIIRLVATGLFGPDLGLKFIAHLEDNSDVITAEEILDTFNKTVATKVMKNLKRIDVLNKGLDDAFTTVKANEKITKKQAKNLCKFLSELPNDLAFKGGKNFLELGYENCIEIIGEDKLLIQKFTDAAIAEEAAKDEEAKEVV